ncbi:hypothetical protein BU23DRAFT_565325 [Bimuria novae-zelandiae CBS 107.79]|uniref:CoA-dependent acyltransferase n=1 Tax=Bimuria novae-zelandiae CBS 107.79 TaxID=1447943 RepID=A0A6A5VJ00_9PLEO|nr:hypothetical protein BU23DRAFT_565325 [Bimuria novae-zelandiae CBS 107.79]
MASLFGWWKGRQVQPERVPTDTVIPFYFLDGNSIFTNIIMDLSLQFDQVLDVEKLVRALEQLLEKPGWRKLRARLRRSKSGKCDYHVPAVYTPERPAISFSHTKYDIALREYPIGSTIPCPNDTIQVSGDTKAYRPLFLPPDSPTKVEDWLCTDRPQIVLHIVSFTDITLIKVTWLHSCMDAMSLHLLFTAWTAMLSGREEDVPETCGELEDPLATLGAPSTTIQEEEFLLTGKHVTGLSFIHFVLALLWDLLLHRREEIHYLILPAPFISTLQSSVFVSLPTLPPLLPTPNTADPTKPFLSPATSSAPSGPA